MGERLGKVVYWSGCGTATLLILWGLAGALGYVPMTVDGIAGSLALALMSWIAGRAAFYMLAARD
jgi:hypothetical protein